MDDFAFYTRSLIWSFFMLSLTALTGKDYIQMKKEKKAADMELQKQLQEEERLKKGTYTSS